MSNCTNLPQQQQLRVELCSDGSEHDLAKTPQMQADARIAEVETMYKALLANQQATDAKLLSQGLALERMQSEIAALQARLQQQLTGSQKFRSDIKDLDIQLDCQAAAQPDPQELDDDAKPEKKRDESGFMRLQQMKERRSIMVKQKSCPMLSSNRTDADSTFCSDYSDCSNNDSVCSEFDLDAAISAHVGLDLQSDAEPVRAEPAPSVGVFGRIFRWVGALKKRKARAGALAARAERTFPRQYADSSPKGRAQRILRKTMAVLDKQAAKIQRRVKRTEARLQALYEDPEIESPSTHPKVGKLLRTLIKQKRAAASLNMKRYEMHRSVSV